MNVRIGFSVACMLAIGATAEAQPKPGTFGFGASVGQQFGFAVPMTFGRFRLEAELAYFGQSSEEESGGITFKETNSVKVVGLGGYFIFAADDNFHAYVGPRVGFWFFNEELEQTGNPDESFSRRDPFIGLALGAEHFLSSRASIGAEARLNRISAGEAKFEPEIPDPPKFEASQTSTDGLVFVRFYFR